MTVLTAILTVLLALAGCGKDAPLSDAETATTAPATTGTTSTAAVAARHARDGCKAVPTPVPARNPTPRRRPREMLSSKSIYTAVLRTNCGTIRILLAVRRAPRTTSSFASLVRNRFYDGLTFHRIAKPGGNDYVIQGGDPGGDGNGGPGYSVIETPRKDTKYARGVVAMAKTATDPPGASGSQFFIVTAKQAPLPPEYALLGRVIGSYAAVDRIARLETDPVTETPIDPVVIQTATVRRG